MSSNDTTTASGTATGLVNSLGSLFRSNELAASKESDRSARLNEFIWKDNLAAATAREVKLEERKFKDDQEIATNNVLTNFSGQLSSIRNNIELGVSGGGISRTRGRAKMNQLKIQFQTDFQLEADDIDKLYRTELGIGELDKTKSQMEQAEESAKKAMGKAVEQGFISDLTDPKNVAIGMDAFMKSQQILTRSSIVSAERNINKNDQLKSVRDVIEVEGIRARNKALEIFNNPNLNDADKALALKQYAANVDDEGFTSLMGITQGQYGDEVRAGMKPTTGFIKGLIDNVGNTSQTFLDQLKIENDTVLELERQALYADAKVGAKAVKIKTLESNVGISSTTLREREDINRQYMLLSGVNGKVSTDGNGNISYTSKAPPLDMNTDEGRTAFNIKVGSIDKMIAKLNVTDDPELRTQLMENIGSSVTETMRSIGVFGQWYENKKDFNAALKFLSSPSVGTSIKNKLVFTPEAKEKFEETLTNYYTDSLLENIKKSANVSVSSILNSSATSSRSGSLASQISTQSVANFEVIDAVWSNGSFSFRAKPNLGNNKSQAGRKAANWMNSRYSEPLTAVTKTMAHIDNRTDYEEYYNEYVGFIMNDAFLGDANKSSQDMLNEWHSQRNIASISNTPAPEPAPFAPINTSASFSTPLTSEQIMVNKEEILRMAEEDVPYDTKVENLVQIGIPRAKELLAELGITNAN